ncbi:hypothetical protein Y032_0016g3021 [Ancylostoma ceylanicum]|nr:hypothetical protein Y032_0016g3021 [Ancylostoma ceylanicum]
MSNISSVFGWRVEIISAGYKVERYNTSIARYKMIKHGKDSSNPVNPCRYKLLAKTKRDWKTDGLSSLRYKLLNVTLKPLYTHILVDLLEAEEKPSVNKQFCEVKNVKQKRNLSIGETRIA